MAWLISFAILLGIIMLAFIIGWLMDEHIEILIWILIIGIIIIFTKLIHLALFEGAIL